MVQRRGGHVFVVNYKWISGIK